MSKGQGQLSCSHVLGASSPIHLTPRSALLCRQARCRAGSPKCSSGEGQRQLSHSDDLGACSSICCRLQGLKCREGHLFLRSRTSSPKLWSHLSTVPQAAGQTKDICMAFVANTGLGHQPRPLLPQEHGLRPGPQQMLGCHSSSCPSRCVQASDYLFMFYNLSFFIFKRFMFYVCVLSECVYGYCVCLFA